MSYNWELSGCKPECHPYFLHGICFPHSVVHHQYEFQQVNFPIVIHVNGSHQSIDLRFCWVAAWSRGTCTLNSEIGISLSKKDLENNLLIMSRIRARPRVLSKDPSSLEQM